MCGIAGLIDWRAATSADALRAAGEAMNETLRHRGPDDGAIWAEAEGGVVLGQRRLAIIDLSPGGAQPMHSADRRYVITFNGEIYNYRDIRQELAAAGRAMRSDSDTEVLLEACALWGVEAAIERTIGMFAFALWDRSARTLHLARDRLGIKPLYYAASPDRLLFASQLKAFRALPGWQPTIDEDAVAGFLRFSYIAQPRTIYREAAKLPPGHVLTLRAGRTAELKCFWDARAVAIAGQARNDPDARRERGDRTARRVAARFREAAHDRRRAARRVSFRRHRLLDRGRSDAGAKHAPGEDILDRISCRGLRRGAVCRRRRRASAHRPHGILCGARARAGIGAAAGRLVRRAVCRLSQIPALLISELTRKHVTVALSGDGGDELFAGYNRYLWAERFLRVADALPQRLHRPMQPRRCAAAPEYLDAPVQVVPSLMAYFAAGGQAAQDRDILDDASPETSTAGLSASGTRPTKLPPPGRSRMGLCADRSLARRFPGFRCSHAVSRSGELSA